MRKRSTVLLGLCIVTLVLATGSILGAAAPLAPAALGELETRQSSCREAQLSGGYVRRVHRALGSKQDVWGNALLSAPGGPTYERASRFLRPLLLARAPRGRLLTESGVHYAHFAEPDGAWGATSVALHVADGSQIVSERWHGRELTVGVGPRGRERYGSCLRRLRGPALADGHLPILQTAYRDASGVRYRQESFAARIPETRSLVSFVKVTADARNVFEDRAVRLRFTPSAAKLEWIGQRLRGRGRTHLFFSAGGTYDGSSVRFDVAPGSLQTAYVAWLHTPVRSDEVLLDETRYQAAQAAVRLYWERRLARGASIVVPEQRVQDAQRNLLIQNLGLTWRYSIGNGYEQLSTPEGMDGARVIAAYGHSDVSRAILHTSAKPRTRKLETPVRNPNWKMGAKLVGFVEQARLSGYWAQLERSTPTLSRYVRALGRQIRASRTGLLWRERYSSDVGLSVYGLHSQTVVWQGLQAMAHAWERTGHSTLARTCRELADRLGAAIRRAVRASQRRLPDGSLFIPVRLLDGERPYQALTSTRLGSYWNLVMPYALASGFFRPGSPEARGVLEYMRRHGSRLLGLVRTGAFTLYRHAGDERGSGSNPVYGLNVARFLADNDEPDELVLSLYGQLAAAMSPGTFISGEGASIAPLAGDHYRSMYLPPNSGSNAAFLETLRLMLVHETRSRLGAPLGLELAFATPRGWLRPGKWIEVRRLPTSFGPVSYTIEAAETSLRVTVDVPQREPLRRLRLRLRLPESSRIASVSLDGVPYEGLERDGETIGLPVRPGPLTLDVELEPRP